MSGSVGRIFKFITGGFWGGLRQSLWAAVFLKLGIWIVIAAWLTSLVAAISARMQGVPYGIVFLIFLAGGVVLTAAFLFLAVAFVLAKRAIFPKEGFISAQGVAERARITAQLDLVKKAGTTMLDPVTIAGIWAGTLDPHEPVRHLHFRAIKEAIAQGKLPGTVLKDGKVNKDARVPVAALQRFWVDAGVMESEEAKETFQLDWLPVTEAIDSFCDPAIVWRRNKERESLSWYSEKCFATEAEMRTVYDAAPPGFKDSPEEQKKYNALQAQLQRYSEANSMTKTGLRYAWEDIYEETQERLCSGELIAKGFAEPYKGGDDLVQIKQSEWRILLVSAADNTAVRKGEPSKVVYSGVQIARIKPPALEIIFDPTNPGRKFWSLDSNKDETGKAVEGAHWEYRAMVKNKSPKTLRNVKVTVEAIGPMPSRPEPSHFDVNKERLVDLNPEETVLAIIRWWWNPPIVVGMVCGGAYGPIKMTVSADDVRPTSKLFWFDPELTPMISEIKLQ